MLDQVGSDVERYLDLVSYRQKLVASNIANAETPGYKTKDIDFQQEFQSAVREGQPGAPNVAEVIGLKVKNDGNNVSVDREARLLSENALRFSAASQILKTRFTLLKSAIQEGKSG